MEETLLKAGNIDGEPCLSCDDAGRHMAIKMHNPIQIRGTSREADDLRIDEKREFR